MKKILLIGFIGLALIIALFLTTFSAEVLPIGDAPEIEIPTSGAPASLTITAISAGTMLSKAGLAYRGGDLSEPRTFAMGGVLIKHPKGNLLVDAGFGSAIKKHFLTTPKMMQWTAEYQAGKTVAEQLPEAGITPSQLDGIILTHAHWDHISGVEDLPNTPIWLTQAEADFVNSGSEHTLLARMIGTQNYKIYDFPDGEFLGFQKSHDVFKDGSVVIVPAAGHSPGAVIVFISLANQQRYVLIGDLAWQGEGVDLPAEKPWMPRVMLGEDTKAVRKLLVHMHHLQKLMPSLTVVASHDQRAWNSLPGL